MNRRKEMIKTKTVYDLMKEQDSERLKADFLEKQKQDYDFKVAYAENRAKVLDFIGVRYEVPETRETQKEKSPAEAVTSNKEQTNKTY